MSSFKPASRIPRPPIHNPYDKFSKPDFDNWVDNLTGSIRYALGRDQPASAASTRTDSRSDKYDSVSDVDAHLSPEADYEPDSLSANGFGHSHEQQRHDLGRHSSVLSTGDDPSQPIELDSDSEESEREDNHAIYEENDEEEDHSESQDDELHEDAEIHVNGFIAREDIIDDESETEEYEEAETFIPPRRMPGPSRVPVSETHLRSDDEPEITVIDDDDDDDYESEHENDDGQLLISFFIVSWAENLSYCPQQQMLSSFQMSGKDRKNMPRIIILEATDSSQTFAALPPHLTLRKRRMRKFLMRDLLREIICPEKMSWKTILKKLTTLPERSYSPIIVSFHSRRNLL
jgi:hypothetical protein